MKGSDSEDERSLLAGEYVLGLQDAAARAAVEQALPADAALLAAVYDWQDRLLPLLRRVNPVVPDAQAWPAIEAAFRRRLGAGVKVSVKFVEAIAPERSGKFRYVVSHVESGQVREPAVGAGPTHKEVKHA